MGIKHNISNEEIQARLLRIERMLGIVQIPATAITSQRIKEIRDARNLSLPDAYKIAKQEAITSLYEEERV